MHKPHNHSPVLIKINNPAALRLLHAAMQNTAANFAPLVASLRPADWADFATLVEYHEIVPLVWHRLRHDALPAELAATWREHYYLNAVRNDARIAELKAVLRDLAECGIAPVLLKGMALAPSVYGNIALRQMADMDMLVRREDLGVTWAVLSARGYLVPAATPRYWRLQFRNGGELRLVHQRSTALIEVHWWLCAGTWAAQSGLLTRCNPWRRVRADTLDDQPVLRLHPHDEVLHIAHHLAVSNQFGSGVGRMLVDLDRLIRASSINWPKLLAEARALNVATMLWLALHVVQELLATPIPSIAQQLAPPLWQRWLLQQQIQPCELLAGADPRRIAVRRYLLLLAMLDQPRDMLGMIRTGIDEWRSPITKT